MSEVLKYKLVEMQQLSGPCCTCYSFLNIDTGEILFEQFVKENTHQFKNEVKEILSRLKTMANETGAQINFFKENEGIPSHKVMALYDHDGSHLRLYCVRYGTCMVMLGSGGYKPKSIRRLQEDPKLELENKVINLLADEIERKRSEGEVKWVEDGFYLDFPYGDEESQIFEIEL